MFGTNERVGKREFGTDRANTLRVTSVFFTLQGEGPLSGQPSVFVRLAKCNLACSFCDTYFDTGETYTFDDLDLLIQRRLVQWFGSNMPAWAHWTNEQSRRINLVITGGEPLLQSNLYDFIDFERRMRAWRMDDSPTTPQFATVQIETNGILRWTGDDTTILVVSPKAVENSDGVPLHHIVPHQVTLDRANALKFVIAAPQPMNLTAPQPYSRVPDWALAWSHHTGRPIYVSPMNVYNQEPRAALVAQKTNLANGIDVRSEDMERVSFWEPGLLNMEANQRNHEYAAELAMRHGFTLSLQTHLLASLP